MTVSILTAGASFIFFFIGYILNHFAEAETYLQGWDIGFIIFAIVIAVCGFCEFVYSLARLLCALHRGRRHRKGGTS